MPGMVRKTKYIPIIILINHNVTVKTGYQWLLSLNKCISPSHKRLLELWSISWTLSSMQCLADQVNFLPAISTHTWLYQCLRGKRSTREDDFLGPQKWDTHAHINISQAEMPLGPS